MKPNINSKHDGRRSQPILVLIGTILGLLLSGCNRSDIPPSDTLTVALASAPATLDPRRATDAYGQRIGDLIFSALIRYDPELNLEGDAAEEWSYKNLVYTFKIRPSLTFSDGQAVSADDFVFSIEEARKPSSPFSGELEVISRIEAQTVEGRILIRLHLKKFSAALLTDLPLIKILPKHVITRSDTEFSEKLIGSGPYSVQENGSSQIVLKSREAHYLNPKSKQIVFKIIQDEATRYLKTLKGSIDIASNEIPPQYVKEFENHKDFEVKKSQGLSMTYLLLNLKNQHLKNKKLRQAMAHAIHRDEIIEYKMQGLATPATTIVTPPNKYFVPELNAPEYDLKKAKSLLDESDFTKATFVLKTSNNQTVIENARVLANQLQKAGLNVQLQSYEWGSFYTDVKNGNFEMATMKWVGTKDPNIYQLAFHSRELVPGRNRGSYINPALDKLLESGLEIEDFKKRYEHYRKIQTIVLQDLPIIPLWYDTQITVIHRRVKNYVPSVNGDFIGFIKAEK